VAHSIGIEFISVLAMPPDEHVHLAADLGCQHIGLALAPFTPNPHRYRPWSLLTDAALRRATLRALRERGVSISLGEGLLIRPGADVRDCAAELEVMRELGVRRINTVCIEPDRNRLYDQLTMLVDMAAALDMETTLEYVPTLPIADLPMALEVIGQVRRPGLRLLIDTMHFVRAGGRAEDLAALDPALIGYVQVCDVPLAFTPQGYGDEAKCERMVPGTGELPLQSIIAALPRDMLLGLEIPMLKAAEAGVDPRTRLGQCVEATRRLLAQVGERSH
jgi:sugar phosphate isomerase/epimerase